jgi:hypothetical protein
MDPMVDMQGPQPGQFAASRCKCRQQRARINSTAEGDDDPYIGVAWQQIGQSPQQPLRAERVCRAGWIGRSGYSESSENTPNEAIRSER